MATTKRSVELICKDKDGNLAIYLPITRLGNIEDTAKVKEAISDEDYIPIVDASAGRRMKKIKWADIKSALADMLGLGYEPITNEEIDAIIAGTDETSSDGG